MDKNYQDATNHNLAPAEGKIWLPPSYANHKPPPVSPVPKKRGMNWGFANKSFWEWLLLLGTLLAALGAIAIPVAIAWFSYQQHQTDLQIARDQQQAAILQTYIDNIQDLLLNRNLLQSKQGGDVAVLARARTLTALQGLDPERKGRLLIFLHEANLIGFPEFGGVKTSTIKIHAPIINLTNANLRGADLNGVDLTGANLSETDLREADLSNARLGYADLHDADLRNANLNRATFYAADLIDANFSNADLRETYLSKADIRDADLSGANLTKAVTGEALIEDASLIGTDLSFADLSNTDFFDANLSGANLKGANLGRDNLTGVDFTGANNLTQQQLDQISTCAYAILPIGLTCHHNQ